MQTNPQDKFLRVVTWILLVLCMTVLVRYILFKGGVEQERIVGAVSRDAIAKVVSKYAVAAEAAA